LEVPEIYDGIVEIKAAAREPGYRAKLAVYSKNKDVDPVGSCVGPRGSRVQAISNELRGEKIDIIRWSEDPEEYLGNALSPAKVVAVEMNENEALVIVPDNQLSLAIGKEGQNARLAAKITGFKIDICSESQIAQERFSSLGLGNNEKKNGAAASGEEEIAGTEGTAPEGTAGEKPLNGGAEEGAESAPEDAADESAPEEAGSDSENV
jgi:N utilization substance protein A